MGPPRIFGGLILNCLRFAGNECLSFAPSGLGLFCFPPTAYAVGCILSPLRGCELVGESA